MRYYMQSKKTVMVALLVVGAVILCVPTTARAADDNPVCATIGIKSLKIDRHGMLHTRYMVRTPVDAESRISIFANSFFGPELSEDTVVIIPEKRWEKRMVYYKIQLTRNLIRKRIVVHYDATIPGCSNQTSRTIRVGKFKMPTWS